MGKKSYKLVTIVCILFLSLFVCNFSYGFIKDGYTGKIKHTLVIGWEGEGNTSDKILKEINSKKLGYEGNSLTEEMKFKTYLKIVEAKDGKYKIQFRRKWITNNIYPHSIATY